MRLLGIHPDSERVKNYIGRKTIENGYPRRPAPKAAH